MRPIGLTIKENRKKYGSGRGELMVIHLCIECADVSINRIAADDDPQRLFSVFEQSLRMETALRRRLEDGHILVLSNDETDSVKVQLFGAADHSHLRSVMA
jgi:hypothetical protein